MSAFYSSSMFLLISLVYLVGVVDFTLGSAHCPYHNQGDPFPHMKHCPEVCCPRTGMIYEDKACCNRTVQVITISTVSSFFGYSWWTLVLSIICMIFAFTILCNVFKRRYILKRITIGPAGAFTISKGSMGNSQSMPTDPNVVREMNPPSYSSAANWHMPPPYVTPNPTNSQ